MAGLEMEEKGAYMEALDRVPLLVEEESPPHIFVQQQQQSQQQCKDDDVEELERICMKNNHNHNHNHHHHHHHHHNSTNNNSSIDDGNHNTIDGRCYDDNIMWAAAERCVNYWELRCWLFGTRAFLPMTATGGGCLDDNDCALLRTGFCCLLDGTDKYGRSILYFQVPFQKLQHYDRMALVRVIFYVLSVAVEKEVQDRTKSSGGGIVVVADMKHYTTGRFDRKFLKMVSYLFVGNYHPIQTRAYHMCAPPGNKSCFLLVLPFIKYFMTRHIRQRFVVHTGNAHELAMDLAEYGIAHPNTINDPTKTDPSAQSSSSSSSSSSLLSGNDCNHHRRRQQEENNVPQLPELLGGRSHKAFQEWFQSWLQRRNQIEIERERKHQYHQQDHRHHHQ